MRIEKDVALSEAELVGQNLKLVINHCLKITTTNYPILKGPHIALMDRIV